MLIIGGISVLIVLPGLAQHPFFEDLERKTFDWRASLEKEQWAAKPSDNIVLLNFDDNSFTLYEDEFGTWPWSRNVSAQIIKWLNDEAHVRTVAFDVMFTFSRKEQGINGADGDTALVNAYQNYNNVYTSINFDNNYEQLKKLGKAPQTPDFENLAKGGINLQVNGKTPYFLSDYSWLRLNNYRKILPGLMEVPERLAAVNHIRDRDGVSRTNPLFFILDWDKQNNCLAVNQNDEATCEPVEKKEIIYPYLGFRLFLDLVVPESLRHQPITITDATTMRVGNINIPVMMDGRYLVHWYNTSGDQSYYEKSIKKLEHTLKTKEDTLTTKERNKLTQKILNNYDKLDPQAAPIPYRQIPVWKVLNAIYGKANPEDLTELKESLKDKVVFIGTTSVSTFDIKTTPVHPTMPGVVMQATIFDNLQQHNHFIKRASQSQNMIFSALLWMGCVLCIIYTRSVWIGIAGVGVCFVLYVLAMFWVYLQYDLWVSVAAPLASGIVVTVLTYVMRYLSRTQDFERTYKLATTDAMTGLKNHRYFQEHLANAIARSERGTETCSLIMVDIDYFKKFNDTYGHQAGDRVLKCVALKLEQSVRRGDLVARYGGEEMAVVLSNVSQEAALQVAQKLVDAIGEEAYPIAENVYKHVNISVGVAIHPKHGLTPAQLISTADEGLYRAKEAGRNRVGALPEEVDTSPPTAADDSSATAV